MSTASLSPERDSGHVRSTPFPGDTPAELLLGPAWREIRREGVRVLLRGHLHEPLPELVAAALAGSGSMPGRNAVEALLRSLDGHFALVAFGPGWVLAAVDRVRSVPLLYTAAGSRPIVSDDAGSLSRRLGLGPERVDPGAATAVAMSGYTVGADTLYAGVSQLCPGEYLLLPASEPVPARYYRYRPWQVAPAGREAMRSTLAEITLAALEKVVRSSAGRPIVVPLSAGLDSRLVVAGLRHVGCQDLRCFAYGQPGNFEARASREIARRLGLPWTFVPITQSAQRDAFASKEYAAYLEYADSLTAVPFQQEFLALRTLRDRGWLPADAVVVNGQSGDFISGNHVPLSLAGPVPVHGPAPDRGRVLEALVDKHYGLWACLMTSERLATVRKALDAEPTGSGAPLDEPALHYALYEYSEFENRQTKYVINGQRIYEHFGLEWRLPLWDGLYLDFWEGAPLDAKRCQSLYREMLEAENWGGVFRELPVNRRYVRPRWLVPVRLAAKALHAPLGAERWHRFERRYVAYWMDLNCTYAARPYWTVARDRRGFRNSVSWLTESYLAGKGLGYDGTPV